MTWHPPESIEPAEWRRRAEEQVRSEDLEEPSGLDTSRMLHELRVHQLELEMQNEALREAQLAAEAGWERFQELYDSAPAGFFSVDAEGAILELNLAGARLLGADRAELAFQRFSHFLVPADQAVFASFVRRGLDGRENPPCEVALAKTGPAVRVRLQGASSADGKVLQLSAMDSTGWRGVKADLLEAPLARLEACGHRLLEDRQAGSERMACIALEMEQATQEIRRLL